MTTDSSITLQSTILRLLSQPNVDKRLGQGRYYFTEAVIKAFSSGSAPSRFRIAQTLWKLVGRGLVYIDFSQSAPENWEWGLTDEGVASAKDEQFNPDDPEMYLARLQSDVPGVSDLVLRYTSEAVRSYTHACYLASAVMLGVASEAAFLEMAQACVKCLGAEGKKLQEVLDNPRQPYVAKFDEFRKRIEPKKADLPPEPADGMNLTFNSVLDLLRISRNDAGHPTGKDVSREDQYISLQMFARYLQRLYDLRSFFQKGSGS